MSRLANFTAKITILKLQHLSHFLIFNVELKIIAIYLYTINI